ncbi:unnamed protein product, partial [Rotaria magnacalcarata]
MPETIGSTGRIESPGEINKNIQYEKEYRLAGIILHWKRSHGVQELIRTMLKYENIFSNIIVWNNNPMKSLTLENSLIENNICIEIVNLKDQAKYRACQLAKTKACFYVDDDWDTETYITSLYSSFILEPAILHAMTDQYNWIDSGSIFSCDNAIRHLKYMDLFLNNDANRDLISQGDRFFSMWMNQLPAQFNGRLLQLDESTSSSSSSFENSDFGTLQYRSSVLAIEIES